MTRSQLRNHLLLGWPERAPHTSRPHVAPPPVERNALRGASLRPLHHHAVGVSCPQSSQRHAIKETPIPIHAQVITAYTRPFLDGGEAPHHPPTRREAHPGHHHHHHHHDDHSSPHVPPIILIIPDSFQPTVSRLGPHTQHTLLRGGIRASSRVISTLKTRPTPVVFCLLTPASTRTVSCLLGDVADVAALSRELPDSHLHTTSLHPTPDDGPPAPASYFPLMCGIVCRTSVSPKLSPSLRGLMRGRRTA